MRSIQLPHRLREPVEVSMRSTYDTGNCNARTGNLGQANPGRINGVRATSCCSAAHSKRYQQGIRKGSKVGTTQALGLVFIVRHDSGHVLRRIFIANECLTPCPSIVHSALLLFGYHVSQPVLCAF
jgi:hypothetical protein